MSDDLKFDPDYDSLSCRPKSYDTSIAAWIEYVDHMETIYKLNQRRIAELENAMRLIAHAQNLNEAGAIACIAMGH